MAKMDGLTCSIRYLDGKLVNAETRGNGLIGEDVTHNIFFVKGVPTEIPIKDEVIIDGEIICTYDDFEKFSSEYANPRNFAAGSIRLLSNAECASRHLTFVAWDCIKGIEKLLLSSKFFELDQLGFICVPHIILSPKVSITHAIILLQSWAQEEKYPIDGIVFKYDNCEYYSSLGATGHHFRGGLAYKFYDEEYESNLQKIEWSMGKTSQLTPVAVFDDIDFGDSTVNRASLHNLNIIRQVLGRPYINQKIKVFKANMIIPQISWAEKSEDDTHEYLYPPTICPYCGEPTEIRDDFLYCSNPQCTGKLINHLDHFVGKKGLDIKGLSKQTLEKLIDWGWVNKLHDLFTLEQYRDEWIKKDGFGIKSVDKILLAIQDARDCELWQFISALSIPLIGSTYAKEICKKEIDWATFREDIKTHFDFTHWDGFGYEMDQSLRLFNYKEADELVENVLYLKNSLYNQSTIESEITGKTFCITGKLINYKNRTELKNIIEEHGGKVVDSVSNKTNYLINNDISSTSSKNVKAKSLNIQIITEA